MPDKQNYINLITSCVELTDILSQLDNGNKKERMRILDRLNKEIIPNVMCCDIEEFEEYEFEFRNSYIKLFNHGDYPKATLIARNWLRHIRDGKSFRLSYDKEENIYWKNSF